jgi:citrate lyase beta subunit
VGEAIKAVNRVLKSGRFTADMKRARRDWSLAFTDKATAFAQFPVALTLGRHPGFMIPPSQIYIITDFITPDCANSKVADELLAQVLLHEMGHVIEYLLLGESQTLHDRERSEGFATWFEQYASDSSSAIPKDSVKRYYGELARQSLRTEPGAFQGTPMDYARAALPFQAVVRRKGVPTLMDVYRHIRDDRLTWKEAIMRATGWSRATLERESREAVGKD